MGASDAMAGMGSAERRWRTRVADQRASGLSVKAFCAARGFDPALLRDVLAAMEGEAR